jgi:endopeptidase La
MNQKLKIKDLKLSILQFKYKYLSEIILKLQKHIDNLFINNFLDFNEKNNILGNLFIISKNINLSYNNYIVEKLEKSDKLDTIISEYLNSLDISMNNVFVIDKLFDVVKNVPSVVPLYEEENDIINIISDNGYSSLLELLPIINNNKFELIKSQKDLLNEISNIFIPIKTNYFNVMNHNMDFFWRLPSKFSDSDLLHLTRELWIKNTSKELEYLKIEGYFINDNLSCFMKTSQINYPYIHKIKMKVNSKLCNKSTINNEFIKKFIRYDYLGNIYSMSEINYIKHIEDNYQLYLEITNTSFINIMKDFISKGSEVIKIYEIIFLLLLGTSDNCDIAGLLLGLIKEKKNSSIVVYNLLCQRLPYYLLVKIKKSNNNIKSEIEKLKSLSPDDIDYKKQLLLNKDISPNVKALTLEKIEEMKSVNNEYYKQLTFVKHILKFPWSSKETDILFADIKSDPNKSKNYLLNIEDKLNKLCYGHNEAKKNLLQVIGKWVSNPSSQGTCFSLVGPPGVGKTLLAKSVSKALDIPFAEITLGGQNDGEILHGHGYTYSGSQPGLIIKKMVEMGKSRCILYFDELDKACSKHGSINEITSILIHLTDHNMNKNFQDRFFQGIDFPLDKVIMIFSYNDSKLVDPILLDRLKQIEVSAYTINEKIKIVKEFIIMELALSIGLEDCDWIHIKDDLIAYIINNYTNEAGVRNIKRKIEQIFLNLNLDRIYQRGIFKNKNITEITQDMIINILDKPNNDITIIHTKPMVGIINGLYATNTGDGGVIPIQIYNNIHSNNNFEIKLTGKQGDVMKESVQCSLTAAIHFIKNLDKKKYPKFKDMDFDKLLDNYNKQGFHVHCPSTSVPKDGPSAGSAFTCAFISRILNIPIRNEIAMTGEVELTGKITKIGGLNFKLIGAKKAGVKLIFVPKENEKEIEDIKKKYTDLIDDNLKIKFVDYIEDIIPDILL